MFLIASVLRPIGRTAQGGLNGSAVRYPLFTYSLIAERAPTAISMGFGAVYRFVSGSPFSALALFWSEGVRVRASGAPSFRGARAARKVRSSPRANEAPRTAHPGGTKRALHPVQAL